MGEDLAELVKDLTDKQLASNLVRFAARMARRPVHTAPVLEVLEAELDRRILAG